MKHPDETLRKLVEQEHEIKDRLGQMVREQAILRKQLQLCKQAREELELRQQRKEQTR